MTLREKKIKIAAIVSTLSELPGQETVEGPKEEITYKRNKLQDQKQPLLMELPVHLPRREEVIKPIDLPEDAKKIGETVAQVVKYELASAYGPRIILPKYIVELSKEIRNSSRRNPAAYGLRLHLLLSFTFQIKYQFLCK